MNLHDAVKYNDIERVTLLVEQGADKDEGDISGCTPLYWASRGGHLELAQYLVEQGATLDKATMYGRTPLMSATYMGHLEVTRYLLEQGADRDKVDNVGDTALHDAAQQGYLDITMLLMSYGADLNARNNDDELPIDMPGVSEEIKQAIRDEPRRRMDHGHKRATEQDQHPNAVVQLVEGQVNEEEEVEEPSSKRQHLNDESAVAVAVEAEEDIKVAEEDEDSEPSSDENDD